ncbi:hypothetical protein SSX86_005368 [Deinandra increscens subsp. villosa]|uniref:Uncharacterized protein n=1 Tax=Deinandra increscens subsp. villosa TaxID=3103831 RepID=A0AAP0DTU5_9ASTR
MAEVVATAMLPVVCTTTWEFVQGIVELSKRLKANHLRLVAKMKTLCAQRDDMKDITTKYKSTEDRTIDDWFSKVKDANNLALELEQRFRRKQKKLTMIYVRSRSMLSKEMATMCLDVDTLIQEGYLLRNGPILQGALSEIHEDIRAIIEIRAIKTPRKFRGTYICICICIGILVLLVFSSLFMILSFSSHMMICPESCYDNGGYLRAARSISSVFSGSRKNVCSPSCYEEAIFPRVTRFISSLIRCNHKTVCQSGREEVGVVPRVTKFISSLVSGSHETVRAPAVCQFECVSPWVPEYILKVIAKIWK